MTSPSQTDNAGTSAPLDEEAVIKKRIQEVRDLWLVKKNGISTGTITASETADILLMLAEHGVPPTSRAVREIYGSGSPNIITPLIRAAWLSNSLPARLATRAKGADIPTPLIELWDRLTSEAVAAAQESLKGEREQMDQIRSGLDAQTEALLQKEQIIDERVSSAHALMALQEASLKDLRGSLAAKTQEAQGLAATLADERSTNATTTAQLQATITQLQSTDTELTRQRNHAIAQLQGANAERDASMRNEALLKSRVDELKADVERIRDAGEKSRERADALLQAKTALELEMRDLQGRAGRVDTLEAEVKEAKAITDQLRTKLEDAEHQGELLRRDNLSARNALAQSQASLEVRDRIEADLQKARQDLATVMRERDQLIRNPPAFMQRIEAIEKAIGKLLETR